MFGPNTIERLTLGLNVIRNLPADAEFNMDQWVNEDCGTIACAAGHISWSFEAQALGLSIDQGCPLYRSPTRKFEDWDALLEFFEIHYFASVYLFAGSAYGARGVGDKLPGYRARSVLAGKLTEVTGKDPADRILFNAALEVTTNQSCDSPRREWLRAEIIGRFENLIKLVPEVSPDQYLKPGWFAQEME